MPTRPGYHPDFDITNYPGGIRPCLRKIAAHFYVTRHFKPIEIGNSTYYGALIRPTEEFSIYVNTDREILIVFSLYENFEIRTLEAYNEFYSLLESARIDKSLRFLVSGDPRIESIIQHYLNQYPEYPIIVPTTFQKLEGTDSGSLLEAVRRNYLLRDLFGYQNPLREETFFFGRQHVVTNVLDMAKSGQNSSLFGLRKSGKTSAIYAVQRKAKGFSYNVAVIDCQNPAVHARRYGSLLSYIVTEIRKAGGVMKPVPDFNSNDLAKVSEDFYSQMNNALGQSKNKVLIIFDEIENISPKTAASPHWREDRDVIFFWQTLRSYLQSEGRGRVSVCLVGTSPHVLETALIHDIANPIYLYAQKSFIPMLEFDNTREMIERLGYFMGLEFSPNVISSLQEEYGGHPFFIRQVCSKIHQISSTSRPIAISKAALERAKAEFSGQLESYLRDIVEQLRSAYPEEFQLLKAIVAGEKGEVNEYGREAPELIDHLLGYGLIAKVGDDYDVKFVAIKKALNHLLLAEGGETRWLEISASRNKIESQIRTALYLWSKSLSGAEWESILQINLTKKRMSELLSHEPSILFSNKASPLYLSDLLMLIKDEKVIPHLKERRKDVVKALDILNKMRRDAHAIIVNDADMAATRSAVGVLEGEFAPP